MPTKEEIDQEAMDTAEREYLGSVVDSYADSLSPKAIDKVLRIVAQKNEGVDGVQTRLANQVRMKAVAAAEADAATPEVDKMLADVDKRFDSIMDGFGPRQPQPESEPEPEGQRTAREGEDMDSIARAYGAGEIDTATYEKERAARGLEPMRA